jgi:putative membrane protein
MMYWGPSFGWGGMMFGGLMMVLFWGVLIALGFLAFRAFTRSDHWHSRDENRTGGRREDNALAILKDRYARGEIDKEQYERMRADLFA